MSLREEGGLQKIVLIPTYPHPRNKFCRHEDVQCYPGNKKCPATSFVWPPREFWLLRGEQTGGKNRTDEAETSTFLARVRPETVPPLHTVATGLAIDRGPSHAVYIWSAVILLTSMSGVAVITKRNLISEAVPFVFIVLQSDVMKPGLAMSESAEHIFGMCRTIIREFTTMEFTQIMEKVTRRLSLMFSSDLKSSRDPQKGYGTTFAKFIARTQDRRDVRPDGSTVMIDSSGKSVAEQMWDSVRSVTTYAKTLMQPLLQTLGVQESEMSPFCRTFGSLTDLRDEYVKYQAKTFMFRGKCGIGPTGEDEDTGVVVQTLPPESIVLERVKTFANEMLERDDINSRKDTDSEGQDEQQKSA